MLRRLLWGWKKARFVYSSLWASPPAHLSVQLVNNVGGSSDYHPNVEPYDKMANVWNDFAAWSVPRYDRLLPAATAYYACPASRVLDLACGTGLISRQLAQLADVVVGVDASEAMLVQARLRTEGKNIRYVCADFRRFELGEIFDTVVCGGDSLNYLESPDELRDVFGCVERHLRPGGLFLFDVMDHNRLLMMGGRSVQAEVGKDQVHVHFFYDPERRISESRVVVGSAVERHRRIPVEEQDVVRAAGETGLAMAEHFSANTYLPSPPSRQFYVLRRPGS